MTHHHLPEPGEPPDQGLLLRVARRVDCTVLVWVNGMAAVALYTNTPGTSPTLLFLASLFDLRIWACLFAVAACLLVGELPEAAHVAALVGWVMLGYGATAALVTSSTPSPSGSILGAGLMSTMAALHAFGLYYRAALRRAARGH